MDPQGLSYVQEAPTLSLEAKTLSPRPRPEWFPRAQTLSLEDSNHAPKA